MSDTRLIERWLPIAELGIESLRERVPMTPFPAPNRLHVWWARRPLVASRAAVLASLLPADADRERFLHVLGIHGDPVAARKRIAAANRTGTRLGAKAYGYSRAFGYVPTATDKAWAWGTPESPPDQRDNLRTPKSVVLDPTAGGGTIPLEAVRLGLPVQANDLNPVATLIQRATIDWPSAHGSHLLRLVEELGQTQMEEVKTRLAGVFREEPDAATVRPDGYLHARTVTCPYCGGLVPLSPNWRLAPDGTGVRLVPQGSSDADAPDRATEGSRVSPEAYGDASLGGTAGGVQASRPGGRRCGFEIVHTTAEQSPGTETGGDGACPFPDCERVIDGDEIKRQALAGQMGEQLYAVVFKRRTETRTKSGKIRYKWVRGFRAPLPEDDNSAEIEARLAEKLPQWEAFDLLPSERIPDGNKTAEPLRYGMALWRDLFSPRQLLCHGTSVEVFVEMLEADRNAGELSEARKAAYGYLALALDTLLNYNSRLTMWDTGTGRGVRQTFAEHNFAMKWSYPEMAPLVPGVGYDWAIRKTTKCLEELIAMLRPEGKDHSDPEPLFAETHPLEPETPSHSEITITCKPADALDHLGTDSVDVVVMDPPYYGNVMYAELSDFFYVWLKRTAGRVYPELFRRRLTDKENDAVANTARFRGEKGAKALAKHDYRRRMAPIFRECQRVLKPNGLMTLMFTHKEADAWDALTTGLLEAGFRITASWPVNTESEGGLHIKNKAAAKSTIFLACRPPDDTRACELREATTWWEDVEPQVAQAVRKRVEEFQQAGIGGVDLYLACFGPALEQLSRHWPLRRGTPRPERPHSGRRARQATLKLSNEPNPYLVTPEDALDVARREVKRWRLEQLTQMKTNADLDPPTAFFVLAWDAFRAPKFSFDEALRLARAVGADLDRDIAKRIAQKKGSDLVLWDSAMRAARGALGSPDGEQGMIDVLHHTAHLGRTRSLAEARNRLAAWDLHTDQRFLSAFEAVLEVLPVPSSFTGQALKGAVEAAANDFEALDGLRRLAFADRIDEPEQLRMWRNKSD